MTELNAMSETDASNTSISGANVAENCAMSGLNDAIRGLTGMAKRAYDRDHAGAWVTVGGTANAITLTYSVGPAAYVTGEKFTFAATAANTGATTVNVSGLGAKNVYVIANGTPTALTGHEIANGMLAQIEYDGTQFQLLNPAQDEGSWTPTFVGSGTAGSFTYTNQLGRYVRIGNLVWVECRVTISAISVSPAANMSIAGLPFTASTLTGMNTPLAVGFVGNINFTVGYTQMEAVVSNAASVIALYTNGSNQIVTQLQGSSVSSTADVTVSGVYRIN